MNRLIFALLACMLCIEWTRIAGTVKTIDLKANSVTVEDRDGYLFTVPVDYQVKIEDKGGDIRALKDLQLNQKITLTRTLAERPVTEESTVPEWEPKKK